MMTIDTSEFEALIEGATDEDLADGGRYFSESCFDLTKCGHGDTGEYVSRADGRLVEFLWNHRRQLLALAKARGQS